MILKTLIGANPRFPGLRSEISAAAQAVDPETVVAAISDGLETIIRRGTPDEAREAALFYRNLAERISTGSGGVICLRRVFERVLGQVQR